MDIQRDTILTDQQDTISSGNPMVTSIRTGDLNNPMEAEVIQMQQAVHQPNLIMVDGQRVATNDPTEVAIGSLLKFPRMSVAFEEMLDARDAFLISACEFINHRTEYILEERLTGLNPPISPRKVFEDTIFEIPFSRDWFTYAKIFQRTPHANVNCEACRADDLANAADNLPANDDELRGALLQRRLATFQRNAMGPPADESYTPFTNLIESFLRLASSAKQLKNKEYAKLWDAMVIRSNACWSVLLTRALDYLYVAFAMTTEDPISYEIKAEEWMTFMSFYVALNEKIKELPKGTLVPDPRLREHGRNLDQLREEFANEHQVKRHEIWHKEAVEMAIECQGLAARACQKRLTAVTKLHNEFARLNSHVPEEFTAELGDVNIPGQYRGLL